MAPRAVRASRRRVTYREASFEEDEEDKSFEESADEENYEQTPPPPVKASPSRLSASNAVTTRATTRRKNNRTYKDRGPDLEYREAADRVYVRSKARASSSKRPSHQARTRTPNNNEPRTRRQKPASRIGAARAAAHPEIDSPIPTDGIRPDLSSLPYEILRTIFSYASFPLQDTSGRPTPCIRWLLETARMCHNFKAPALHCLYEAPPITSAAKAHCLQYLLSHPRPEGSFNYSTKVRRLDIEVNVLAHSAPGRGPFDIAELIPRLPQLSGIDIWDRDDDLHSRIFGHRSSRWHYPDRLFEILNVQKLRLKSFHWNGKFVRADHWVTLTRGEPASDFFSSHHFSPSFSRLERLRLTEFPGAPFQFATGLEQPAYYDNNWSQFIQHIDSPGVAGLYTAKIQPVERGRRFAQAICLLQNLTQLTFDLCRVNTVWMQFLSIPLRSLHILSCHEVDSAGLEVYLARHGSQLRELVLSHNLALALSFLVGLKSSCPRLEVLRMDLNYRSSLFASNDAREPEYIDLIAEDEKPSWPSSLRTIELLHLRKWTRPAAEQFFLSLIDSAQDMPDLRHLVLSCSISISWRERAAFRDKWISRFQRVFLRQSEPPLPHLASIRAWREWSQRQTRQAFVLTNGGRENRHPAITPQKRPLPGSSTTNDSSTSSIDDHPARRRPRLSHPEEDGNRTSTRQLRPRRSANSEHASIGNESNDGTMDHDAGGSSLRDMVMQILEPGVQGMCDVVDIRIDNLRPTEHQLTEGDFLDDEPSGDEDWEEDQDEVEYQGNGYAW